MDMSQPSHEFTPPGRPKMTQWERCQQLAKIVDRAGTHEEGSVYHKQYKKQAIDILSQMRQQLKGKQIGLPLEMAMVRVELSYIKIKIIELIDELK